MRPYSIDLRERIVAALEQGQTIPQVARRFNVSEPTVVRYKRLKRTQDSLRPKPLPGRKPALSSDDQQQVQQLFASRSDWTIQTLRDAWQQQSGKRICLSAFHRWMQRLGLSYKKNAV